MRRARLLFVAVCAVATVACSDNSYSYALVSDQKGDPLASLDFSTGISIPEGSAASAHIDFISHAKESLTGGDIGSADRSILRVMHTATDTSRYVFLGVGAGTTHVLVIVNGSQVRSLSATVTAPPASSLPPELDGAAQAPVPADDAGDSSVVTPPSEAEAPDVDAGVSPD